MITINPVTNIVAGSPFSVSGSTTLPSLTCSDDAGTATTSNAPTNLKVKSSTTGTAFDVSWSPAFGGGTSSTYSWAVPAVGSFSFTHPAVTAGSHTMLVSDGTNSVTVSFTATAPVVTNHVISVAALHAMSGAPFTVTGKLTNYKTPPALTYQDDAGAQHKIPTNYVTYYSFAFTHPAMMPGTHSLVVSDGTVNSSTVQYTVK